MWLSSKFPNKSNPSEGHILKAIDNYESSGICHCQDVCLFAMTKYVAS